MDSDERIPEMTFRVSDLRYERPSKAVLRRRMKDKTMPRRERMDAYQFLMYRRKHGLR